MSDRIAATLEKLEAIAVACAQPDAPKSRAFQLEYLALIGELLLEQNRGTAILGPLLDIHDTLEATYQRQNGERIERERRQALVNASPWVMARVSAVIDILVAAGISADHAAQVVSRQMMARNLALPEEGGDSRGWKRVQIWHHRLTTLGRTHPQFEASQNFKDELFVKYGAGAAERALSIPLWDRRTRAQAA
jgi:hypothetical protein